MGVYLPAIHGTEPQTHPVAFQVFEEVQTIHARVQIVSRLADWVIKDEGLKKRALETLEKLRRAAGGRNKVAHAVWGVCEAEPDALILIPNFGHKMVYKLADFADITDRLKKAHIDLLQIHAEFYKSRKR